MTASTQITAYLGCGTHAARPTSPSVPAGCTALYAESDTGNTYAWSGAAWVQLNGGGGGGSAASIVHTGVTTTTSSLGAVTMPAAPTAGNILLAFCNTTGGLALGTGWHQLLVNSSGWDNCYVAWKIAGSGESTSQTPYTGSGTASAVIYEIASGNVGLNLATSGSGSSQSFSVTAGGTGQIFVGIADLAASSVTVSMSGATILGQTTFGSRTFAYFSGTTTGASTTVTVTLSGSASAQYNAVVVS